MASKSGPDIIEDGLVLCLDAASKRSYPGTGTVWTDLKGANNGTLTNGPTFDADNGGGIVFDGTDDSVDFTNSSSLRPVNVSAGIWAKTDGTNSYDPIFCVDDGSRNDYGITIKDGGSGRRVGVQLNTNSGYISGANSASWYDLEADHGSATAILSTQFNYILISYDGITAKIFFNGVEKKSTTSGIGGDIEYPGVIQIAICKDTSFYCGASVAGFHVYNRALTADEVRRNYLSTKERYA
jgi:hypothetical protein